MLVTIANCLHNFAFFFYIINLKIHCVRSRYNVLMRFVKYLNFWKTRGGEKKMMIYTCIICVASVVYLNNSVYVIWISRQFFFFFHLFDWMNYLIKSWQQIWKDIFDSSSVIFNILSSLHVPTYNFYCDGTIVLGFS